MLRALGYRAAGPAAANAPPRWKPPPRPRRRDGVASAIGPFAALAQLKREPGA